eukprot:TRINITY_DN4945_c0_g1_i1.p1 TRINITY_DN4945_c0_g1~~TRINITY_DN4945_c0_g1_i1.p1  ORF type:complete len:440 (-),score=93.96 TRINITY_DN4945_c0_g1_i1:726-2045(-)
MRASSLFLVFSGILLSCWFLIAAYYYNSLRGEKALSGQEGDRFLALERRLGSLADQVESMRKDLKENLGKMESIHQPQSSSESSERDHSPGHAWTDVIPVLLFACNRVSVSRAIDLLLKYRNNSKKFPLIVSQDCGHEATAKTIQAYGDALTFIKQPDLSEIRDIPKKESKFKGYFKIARHYGWALNFTFNVYKAEQVIIVEDDLEISPDFYEYFEATLPILRQDPSLWCVSAWNDNGKERMIDKKQPELLHRTDFFGGLGWMITKELWRDELMSKWPRSYWDDWMRNPQQRKGRSCIRPEISRTKTFGKIGVSNGLFFEKHLKFIQLNSELIPFTHKDLRGLLKQNYDAAQDKVLSESPVVDALSIKAQVKLLDKTPVRVLYKGKVEFKRIAKTLGIMDDFKSGVPRMAYRGVVPTMFKGVRVYVAPLAGWKGYNTSW